MKVLLDGLLPRLYPDLSFLCVPHEGKQDLEKSVPRKLRGWREPGVRFVVLRDGDGDDDDCHAVKRRLADLCAESGRPDALVRIACQELEAWYLGDPEGLAEAFGNPRLAGIGSRARFRVPDTVVHPSAEVRKLVPQFQKVSGARTMGPALSRDRSRSRSFQVLLEGIDRLVAGMSSSQEAEGTA